MEKGHKRAYSLVLKNALSQGGHFKAKDIVIVKYNHLATGSKFDDVVEKGLPSGYKITTIYKKDQLLLKIIKPNKQTTK
ncbi:hypothetical protein ACFVRR_12005 [Gottfriedia sp. NPDC057948]|uniref:hypothetical protein n=1 Tax=Gottfriedia sp. NPDC057948 TaxID=3346287 RepID=UPI0036DEB0B6